MTTFGKKAAMPAPAPAKATFGKKVAAPPQGRMPPPPTRLSPQATAFLETERRRAAAMPQPKAEKAAIPGFTAPKFTGKPADEPAPSRYYSAPRESRTDAYADKPVWGRRVIARFVDEIGVWVLIFAVFNQTLMAALSAYVAAEPGSAHEAAAGLDLVGYALIFMVAQCVYNIAMESSSLQATIGKLMVGAVVTARDGRKPTLGSVIMRNTVGRFVANVMPFYAGYLIGLFNSERRCLHDMMSGTVVRKRVPGASTATYGEVFA